ncbi:gamma-aminobutyric acid receptor subunit beta-like isoform X1 [Montipora foliosa]|uniref:gamma-aminobutyric acid receptor subunit beta-like isoform X1 n=2 Tax=Montipora foliosa TaxID=591990 RepID=UPI0035F1BBF0
MNMKTENRWKKKKVTKKILAQPKGEKLNILNKTRLPKKKMDHPLAPDSCFLVWFPTKGYIEETAACFGPLCVLCVCPPSSTYTTFIAAFVDFPSSTVSHDMWLFTVTTAIFLGLSNSTEVSVNKTTLDRLFTTYDKDVRPNHGVGRLLIEVDLYVESFANIAEADMEYTVFGYLRHHWTDKRLAGKFQDPVLLKGTTIERAWLPDTYISNARESNFPQKDSESQSSLLVSSDGGLFYSKGVKIVASCDMRLEDFPMDTQECALFFSSYGYGVKDIIYKWKRDTATVEKTHIAQFVVNHVQIDSTNVTYESGNFTQLVIRFSFKRRIGYYVIQVYLPASLMVAISWIVFWLDQDDMGGRVGLGITTILTIMFLLGSVNTSLPRVSYPKAIDWFLIASFLMVFLVLAECIVVYILRPKKDDKNDGNELPVGFELEPDETNEEMLTEANGGKPLMSEKTAGSYT